MSKPGQAMGGGKHPGCGEVAAAAETAVWYISKRLAMVRYAEFVAAGYPIGSGMVESADKVVVEAWLKGAGMRWARTSVNPMLALRNLVSSQRWVAGWARISQQQSGQRR